ncbi:MAG: 1,4-beta-xylanase [Firmicutes bacterium]|nr:1,4-beta-xylanase [Bacillota bacterium]
MSNLAKSICNLDSQIKRSRTTTVTLQVLKEGNTPLANQEVMIGQTKHRFLFGCNGFDFVPYANNELSGKEKELVEGLSVKFTDLFNFVTLPFYWGRFEPKKGNPDTKRLTKVAQWCDDLDLTIKGHPLSWHTHAPDWLLAMSNQEILAAQLKRIERDVTGFKGLIDMWDVINEVVIMPIFDKYDNGLTRLCKELGRIDIIRRVFEAARATNPDATFLLNDFDVSPAYDILVEGCLEAGIEIDVLGIQSHMHQGYWGVEETQFVLEQFARFNKPIHFTENTIISGELMPPEIVDLNDYQVTDWPTTPAGEDRQAEEVVKHYRTLFAHPLVEGITWWDFTDGKWLNAPCGLVRKDGSAKPAYDELLKLVKGEWWVAPTKFVTDQDGKVEFCGFFGDYKLDCAGRERAFSLEKEGPTELKIKL